MRVTPSPSVVAGAWYGCGVMCWYISILYCCFFFFSSRRRHTRFDCDWSSDVCSSDLCNDCVSAFGSAGSFSAGIHGRKNLTPNLSLLAGIAYAQYNEGGYRVTSSPIGAFALRYDFADWGSSRPFFDIGTILSPFQKVRYSRSYTTSLGAVSLESSTSSENYAVYGRAGWISRLSPRDEVAASVEVWQLWQRVKGYMDPATVFNPFDASVATGTDRTNLVKVGGQWTHLFGSSVEANIN